MRQLEEWRRLLTCAIEIITVLVVSVALFKNVKKYTYRNIITKAAVIRPPPVTKIVPPECEK